MNVNLRCLSFSSHNYDTCIPLWYVLNSHTFVVIFTDWLCDKLIVILKAGAIFELLLHSAAQPQPTPFYR